MNLTIKIFWITLFSIAMAFLESAVVVYLRALYYPEGFDFPLQPIDGHIAVTEILREAATMIMLIGIAVLAGRTVTERFAWFIYCFAVWDIFYYVLLKVMLNWPGSLMTWDILFLIPVVWTGPVISPVLVSFTMILFAGFIIHFNNKIRNVRIIRKEWLILILGSIVMITAFCWDYSRFILEHYSFSELFSQSIVKDMSDLSVKYIPDSFNWWLFLAGEVIILLGIGNFFKRNYNLQKMNDPEF